MTETTRRMNPAVRKQKRTGRKQLAKTSPSTTPSTVLGPTTSNPPLPQQLPLRTRPEPEIDQQPPRYSVLFPPEQISLPQPPRPSFHLPHTSPPIPSSPLPPPAERNGCRTAPSDAAITRPIVNFERPSNNTFIQQQASPEAIAQEALRDLISTKFDSVINSIDGEQFYGHDQELVVHNDSQSGIRGGWGLASRQVTRGANRAISTAVVGTNYFAKANLYANSRLPPNLPPLQL